MRKQQIIAFCTETRQTHGFKVAFKCTNLHFCYKIMEAILSKILGNWVELE